MKEKPSSALRCVVPRHDAEGARREEAKDEGEDAKGEPSPKDSSEASSRSPSNLSRSGSFLKKLKGVSPRLLRSRSPLTESSEGPPPTPSTPSHGSAPPTPSSRQPVSPKDLPRRSSALADEAEAPASDQPSPGPSPVHGSRGMRSRTPLSKSLAINRHVDSVEFPSMSQQPLETATRHWFEWKTKLWREAKVDVKLQCLQFAGGRTCTFHFLMLIQDDGTEKQFVARRRRDGKDGHGLFETECITSATCQSVAEAWNALKPLQRVNFLDNFLLQRTDGTWLGVEPYLAGKHTRIGGNRLGLLELGSQKSPQAFSHFSHQYTDGHLLVVGFRGAGAYYRHPTVLSHDGNGFGLANVGQKGIDDFFHRHWCNSVCFDMKLETHLPGRLGQRLASIVIGDVPKVEPYRVSDFVGDVRPLTNDAQPEELTVLGLSEEQFNQLVHIFRSLDPNESYALEAEEVQHVFAQARLMDPRDPKGRSYMEFAHAVQKVLDARGRVTFKEFLLCWTNNQQSRP